MKHLLLFESFTEEEKEKIDNYPFCVKILYRKFNKKAQLSINDNLDKFAKVAKKVFYSENKKWKDFFQNKEIKKIDTLSEVINAFEKWLK